MANVTRLVNVGIVPEQAKELAKQIDGASGGTVESLDVSVAAYPAGGITSGNLQAVLEALADRIEVLENA